jgi:F-box and leucine-rich repeat protein 10/11
MSKEQGRPFLFLLSLSISPAWFGSRAGQRRCIHDEYGRIDPVKAQERSKPRVAASQKRPRPNEDGGPNKKPRPEGSGPTKAPAPDQEPDQEPELEPEPEPEPEPEAPVQDMVASLPPNKVQSPPAEAPGSNERNQSYESPSTVKLDGGAAARPIVPSEPATSLVSPPTSLVGEMEVSPDPAPGDLRPSLEREPEAEHTLHTPTSSSRHSSRQPRQVDRYVPEAPAPKTAKPASIHRSSSAATTANPPARKKSMSRPTSSHAIKSVSPALDKKPAATQPSKGVKRDRTSFAESEADAESLRLIRELQEQDFGLRRRAARLGPIL